MKTGKLRTRAVRTLVLLSLITIGLLMFVFRLFQLQVLQYSQWSERSKRNHITKRTLEMKRGSITDRSGHELAISVETYSVFLFTREVKSLAETATLLSTVLPLTRDEILARVAGKRGYLLIHKDLERGVAAKLRQMNIPGVNLEETYRRFYPQGSLASNLIGFTGAERRGLEGIELSFDKTLRGYAGLAVQEDISIGDDGAGRLRVVRPPMGGNNVTLTIDSFIQHILESEIEKVFKKYDPIDVTAIAMDPFTGEILGMANLPNYDLNNFSQATPDSRRNRAIVDIYEPGSCIKIFATACALQNGKISSSNRFYCRGYADLPGRRVRCVSKHGLTDINSAIAVSCNVAMVHISRLVEPHMIYRTYRQLGFGEPTGINFPGESAGILRPPSKWSGFSVTSLCIGQEMAATSLQLITSYAAIANGGLLMEPLIIRKLESQTGDTVDNFQPVVKRRVFSPELARRLKQMLFEAVETGTGRQALMVDYTAGGKTSTAQKANPKGGYFNNRVVVSFSGIAPITNPRVVVYVAVNEPKGDERTLYGGRIAAPAFAVITDRILKHMKVPPDKKPTVPAATTSATASNTAVQKPSLASTKPGVKVTASSSLDLSKLPFQLSSTAYSTPLPDFRGKTLREVIRISNELQIKAIFDGNGVAVDQNPPAGAPISETGVVMVKFSSTGDF